MQSLQQQGRVQSGGSVFHLLCVSVNACVVVPSATPLVLHEDSKEENTKLFAPSRTTKLEQQLAFVKIDIIFVVLSFS